jgi:multidrug/hemolysin transport system permease protein
MIAFMNRNLKLYLRDRSAVMFSLLAVFIVIGLYVLFLGETWTSNMKDIPHAKEMMNHWIMAGVLSIISVTTTMGMLGTMVKDRAMQTNKDFFVAPVKRSAITGGYMLGALVVGIVMTIFAFILAEIFIVVSGGDLLTPLAMLKILGLIFMISLMNTALVLLIVSLFSSLNAFSTASSIVGTLIGFITGIYLPVGMYPNAVQWVIKLFPVSHGAVLFRKVMMDASMEKAFAQAPKDMVLEIKEQLGVVYFFGDRQVGTMESLLFIIGSAVVFWILASFIMKRKTK